MPIEENHPVIGFRRWRGITAGEYIRAGEDLRSLAFFYKWKQGVNKVVPCHAEFHRRDKELTPSQYCECGLYGHYTLQHCLDYKSSYSVIGSIIAWGDRVFFDRTHFRAEYGMVVALLDPQDYTIIHPKHAGLPGKNFNQQWNKIGRDMIEKFSLDYGVPILGKDELEEYTMQFGDPYEVFVDPEELKGVNQDVSKELKGAGGA